MKAEVSKIVENFDIKIVDSTEKAQELMSEASEKCYVCIVTGKLSKQGESKYYAVCTLKKALTSEQKSTLARLYLETVVLHTAIRDMLVDKSVSSNGVRKSKGMF